MFTQEVNLEGSIPIERNHEEALKKFKCLSLVSDHDPLAKNQWQSALKLSERTTSVICKKSSDAKKSNVT